MLAENGPAGPPTTPDPERILADLILSVIQESFPSARLVETTKEDDALTRCRDQEVTYLVVPRIIHWGNNTTFQSRFADSVSVDLRLLQVATRELVKSIRYQSCNNSVTIASRLAGSRAAGKRLRRRTVTTTSVSKALNTSLWTSSK